MTTDNIPCVKLTARITPMEPLFADCLPADPVIVVYGRLGLSPERAGRMLRARLAECEAIDRIIGWTVAETTLGAIVDTPTSFYADDLLSIGEALGQPVRFGAAERSREIRDDAARTALAALDRMSATELAELIDAARQRLGRLEAAPVAVPPAPAAPIRLSGKTLRPAPPNSIGWTRSADWDSDSAGKPLAEQLADAGIAHRRIVIPNIAGQAGNAYLLAYVSPTTGKPLTVLCVPYAIAVDAYGERYHYFEGSACPETVDGETWIYRYDEIERLRRAP